MLVVDADSHWSEPPDLFTSRAPAEFKDRVPRVEEIDGPADVGLRRPSRWAASAPAASSAATAHKESAHRALMEWDFYEIHVGAYDPKVRLGVLDECGIDAQVIFPSTIGLGGQDLGIGRRPRPAPAGHRDLQRRHGRDPGRLGQPVAAAAAHAGVERGRLRPRGAAGRRARRPRRQHDVGPAGPGCARPGQPGVGPLLGGRARTCSCRCTSTSGPASRHDLLRQVSVGVARRQHEAGHRRHAALHRQRPAW